MTIDKPTAAKLISAIENDLASEKARYLHNEIQDIMQANLGGYGIVKEFIEQISKEVMDLLYEAGLLK